MPDEPTPRPDMSGDEQPESPEDAGTSSKVKPDIRPGMSEQEIRDAGLAIDVPFETTGEPDRLRYANLGKPYKPNETSGDKK